MARSRVLFSYAFRPLFLLCTVYGVVALPMWVSAWAGWLPMPSIFGGNPVWWHAHEMLFGFAGAAIGGFLLTAVATWTQRPPVAGGLSWRSRSFGSMQDCSSSYRCPRPSGGSSQPGQWQTSATIYCSSR